MEAADDISYCLSDLEDGVEKEILTHSSAISGIKEACANCSAARDIVRDAEKAAKTQSSVPEHIAFRSRIIRDLVNYAAEKYLIRHNDILAGTVPDLIDKKDPYGQLLSSVKTFARKGVYNHKIPQTTELVGWAVITGLLDHFRPLLDLDKHEFMGLAVNPRKPGSFPREFRLLNRVAPRHLQVYVDQCPENLSDDDEFSNRAHMIVDFISGMTDQFALKTYQSLSGIER